MSVTVELTLVSGLIVIVLGGLFCVFIFRLMVYLLQFLFGLFVNLEEQHEEKQENRTHVSEMEKKKS